MTGRTRVPAAPRHGSVAVAAADLPLRCWCRPGRPVQHVRFVVMKGESCLWFEPGQYGVSSVRFGSGRAATLGRAHCARPVPDARTRRCRAPPTAPRARSAPSTSPCAPPRSFERLRLLPCTLDASALRHHLWRRSRTLSSVLKRRVSHAPHRDRWRETACSDSPPPKIHGTSGWAARRSRPIVESMALVFPGRKQHTQPVF